jgi:hypothetical protein
MTAPGAFRGVQATSISRLWFRSQHEADAAHGSQKPVRKGIVHLAAQARDMYVDHIIQRRVSGGFLPNFPRQHFARNHMIGVPHEVFEQFKLAGGQIELPASSGGNMLDAVEFQILQFHAGRGIERIPASESADSRQQLGNREWLGKKIVRTRIEPVDFVFDSVFRSNQQDGSTIAETAQIAHDFDAVTPRKHYVEDQEIEGLRLREEEPVLTRCRHSDRVLLTFQPLFHGCR